MVEAIFTETTTSLIIAGLTQWDYGQKLHIKGLELPEVAQIHFCNITQKEAIVMPLTKHDDAWICEIPNVLLEYNYDIKAWIFVTSKEQGETVKTIYLKVEKRAKPQDFISENPDATDILSDVVNKVNQNIKDNAEFKEDITEQQSKFENKITTQQSKFETEITTQQNQFETENEQKFNEYYEELKKISANFMSVEDVDRICGGEYDPIYDDYNAQSITQEELEKILI